MGEGADGRMTGGGGKTGGGGAAAGGGPVTGGGEDAGDSCAGGGVEFSSISRQTSPTASYRQVD